MRVFKVVLLTLLIVAAMANADRCANSCLRLRRCPYYPTRNGEVRILRNNKSCANCLNNCNGLGRGVWGR